jgi:hypothetical protein
VLNVANLSGDIFSHTGDPGMQDLPSPQKTSVDEPARPTLTDLLKLYEDGKHRRYTLLFTVNGGAFAVAKLMTQNGTKNAIVLGALTLGELSLGLILMTAIMVVDIYAFGDKMSKATNRETFGRVGKIVLILLGSLIILGWSLMGLVP